MKLGLIAALLTALLIFARLLEVSPVASWSWWLVFSPLFLYWAAGCLLFVVAVAFIAKLEV